MIDANLRISILKEFKQYAYVYVKRFTLNKLVDFLGVQCEWDRMKAYAIIEELIKEGYVGVEKCNGFYITTAGINFIEGK